MGCKCQLCGKRYRVDLIVPDIIWEKIKPDGKASGSGLLCGSCMLSRIEGFGRYGVIRADGDNNAFKLSD